MLHCRLQTCNEIACLDYVSNGFWVNMQECCKNGKKQRFVHLLRIGIVNIADIGVKWYLKTGNSMINTKVKKM